MKFSKIELIDLLKSWIAISLAFAILLGGESFITGLIVSGLTVGLGFLIHELSHKFLAQKFHCWAEFRSNDFMLVLAIVMAFIGFIFVAPGAVVIDGRGIDYRRNGLISSAGPASSLILSILFLPLAIFTGGVLQLIGTYGYLINAWLGLFNLIPVWNFDGKKILAWNKWIYGIMVVVALILVFGRSFFF